MPRVSILLFYVTFIYDFLILGYITYLYDSSNSNIKYGEISRILLTNYYYFYCKSSPVYLYATESVSMKIGASSPIIFIICYLPYIMKYRPPAVIAEPQ